MFVISAEEMNILREKLLSKIDSVQRLKSEKEEKFKQLNKNFFQFEVFPKVTAKSWPKFLCIWQIESPNFHSSEAHINVLRS